ncbi:MAG TPA: HD domain-containing phosphohydrolase [Solirubrobacteraceae bacterium]|jgi:putative nucleotidyltransferase with HDIG domain|nr:HD domain-containing phosphohydrolase [Solirubrobacteraceae bacterium]
MRLSASALPPAALLRRHGTLLYDASQALLLLGCLIGAALSSSAADWTPLQLVALLLALGVVGERLELTVGSQSLSAGFVALVLAMTLLGPAPAVAIALVAIAVDSISRRPSLRVCLSNTAAYAAFALLGGMLVRVVLGDVHDASLQATTRSVGFALLVFGVFVVTNVVNFALIAIQKRVLLGRGLVNQARTLFVPMLPGQFAAAILAAMLAVAYTNLHYPALVGVVVVILIFQYLARALLRSEDRAEQLEARSVRLASMQLGVLVTLVETLALRDRMTARHAAAVARYARALARELGCDEADQDLTHTAGLLHDIGKFALPDRILHAKILSDEDWAVVRRHPQEGATLVGRLDGYGPVADAILYHHEHVDGSGYPAGLIGNEIPLASRILAVCNVYDTLTARDSYRSPMTPQDAIAELRRVAGRQLDAEIVDVFVKLLERDGPVTFAHGDDADFEAELAFERRARALAEPASR